MCELPKGLHLGETAARSAAPSQPTNCERVVSDQERVGWVLLKAGPEPARAERCESWPREELSIPFGCNCRSPHVAALAEKPAGRGGLGCWEFRKVGDAETLRPPAGHPISARGFRSPPSTGNARLAAGDPSAGNGGGAGEARGHRRSGSGSQEPASVHSSEVSKRLVGPLPVPTPGVGFQKQP